MREIPMACDHTTLEWDCIYNIGTIVSDSSEYLQMDGGLLVFGLETRGN
jgi:hypothetical protein